MIRHLVGAVAVAALTLSPQVPQPEPARYYNPRFSSDGTKIIFEATRDGKMAVYTINLDGTGLRRITNARQNDAQPQWSADGAMIAFTSEIGPNLNKVHVMAANGRDKKQISSGPKNDAAPTFSPDGKYVAWAATTEAPENWRDIAIVSPDGSGQRLITSGPGNDHSPVWISNTRLVFVREFPPKTEWTAMTPEDHAKRRASAEIMAVDVTGQNLVNLTNNSVEDGAPSWAAGITRLFCRSFRESAPAFFSMKADGTDVQRVAAAPEAAAFSPDGRFVTLSKVVANRSGIFVRDIAANTEREVVGGDKPKDVNHYNATWSPDGKWLAFESNMNPLTGYGIWIVAPDGTGLKLLTPNSKEDVQPAWSPDGKDIAFSSARDGDHLDIFLMNADGSNVRRLTKTPGGGYYQSAFSPDGQLIAFQGRPDNALFADRVYVVRRDGTGFRELSPDSTSTMSPKWSPDGRWIAVDQQPAVKRTWDEMQPPDMARARSGQEVVAIRPDGSETRVLTKNAIEDCCLRWSADSKSLTFISGTGSTQTVQTMNVDGSGLKPATDQSRLKEPDGERSPDGRFVAYTKKENNVSGVYVRELATGTERRVAGGK